MLLLCSLTTIHGGRADDLFRLRSPPIPPKNASLPVDTADLLHHPDGSWWLHVVVTLEAPVIPQTEEIIGIDLGLAHPAVTSTNRFLGNKAWKATEGRYFRLKAACRSVAPKAPCATCAASGIPRPDSGGIVTTSCPNSLPRASSPAARWRSKTSPLCVSGRQPDARRP